jgi:hypothetical protein
VGEGASPPLVSWPTWEGGVVEEEEEGEEE